MVDIADVNQTTIYGAIVKDALKIPGWLPFDDAFEIVRIAFNLPSDSVLVEIGTYFGRSAALLAGARKLVGNGRLHCIDPFDCSGDEFSVPYYLDALRGSNFSSLRQAFESNIERLGLSTWIDVHQGTAVTEAIGWETPIDLLLLDGDQSPAGARSAYNAWVDKLKVGGVIILRNTANREYASGHDGHRRLAIDEIVKPNFTSIMQLSSTTIAIKAL